jgi:hypothetical protein
LQRGKEMKRKIKILWRSKRMDKEDLKRIRRQIDPIKIIFFEKDFLFGLTVFKL